MPDTARTAPPRTHKFAPRKPSTLPPGTIRTGRRKPMGPTLLDLGRSAAALRDRNHSFEDIGQLLGVTDATVSDCLLLIEGTAAPVLFAVEAGWLAPTTAILLARAEPTPAKQVILMEEARKKARRAGTRRVTAKYFSVPLGKRRHRQHISAVGSFKALLEKLPTTAADSERRQTARWVLDFLDGNRSPQELKKFLCRDGPA